MANRLDLLPRPRELRLGSGALRLAALPELRVRADRPVDAERAKARVQASLGRLARLSAIPPAAGAPAIELSIDPTLALRAEGFTLEITPRGVALAAPDRRGLNWGAGLFAQIALQSGADLPELSARDWPDFASRGYMLDVSRDRVPTMATLYEILDLLETLRLNELQLYTEHTFAYAAHERVWRDASPLTPGQIRQLDLACAERGIELVPNQNSFGHMERWLRHAEYRSLAELEDATHESARGARPAACLAPTPQSVAFMRSLYAELLPNFSSRSLNIGCDETFELGKGRSRQACETRGKGRVYLDFLQNGYGKTIAGPFSARPVPGATVSMPLRWNEVNGKLDPRKFTLKTAPARMKKLRDDPLAPVLELNPDLQGALAKLAAKLK